MGLGDDISKRTFGNHFYEEQERRTREVARRNGDSGSVGCGGVLMSMVLLIGVIVIGFMLIVWFLESRG